MLLLVSNRGPSLQGLQILQLPTVNSASSGANCHRTQMHVQFPLRSWASAASHMTTGPWEKLALSTLDSVGGDAGAGSS